MPVQANNFVIGNVHIKTTNIIKTINDLNEKNKTIPDERSHLEQEANVISIAWKSKPVVHKKLDHPKLFHEKSQYVKDMLTPEKTLYHKKTGYKEDSKTMLHLKSLYRLDSFSDGSL